MRQPPPPPLLSPGDIEARARSAGLSMAEVCRRADIAQSTFQRWKTGETEPNLAVYRRLVEVTRRLWAQ
jgi:transcriptional regulator with XRE-family HTH domain